MARTPEDVIREMLGAQAIRIAQLQSQVDTLTEKLKAAEAERAK